MGFTNPRCVVLCIVLCCLCFGLIFGRFGGVLGRFLVLWEVFWAPTATQEPPRAVPERPTGGQEQSHEPFFEPIEENDARSLLDVIFYALAAG